MDVTTHDEVDELVTWLRGVLDDRRRVAELPLLGRDPSPDVAAMREEGLRRTQAQIAGEREIVDEAARELRQWLPSGGAWDHESETGRARAGVFLDVLCWLAWGHRYDRPGWSDRWVPESARPLS